MFEYISSRDWEESEESFSRLKAKNVSLVR